MAKEVDCSKIEPPALKPTGPQGGHKLDFEFEPMRRRMVSKRDGNGVPL